MQRKKVQTQQMVVRAFDFLEKHIGLFPKESSAEVILTELEQTAGRLAGHSNSQLAGNDAILTSNSARVAAREALINQLELMVTTARALKLDKFWLPRDRADSAYLDTGRNFAEYAAPYEKEFIQQGLPAGFIGNLKTAVKQLEAAKAAMNSQKSSVAGRIGARREFDKTLQEALDLVQRVDSLVLNTMADKPAVMAAWEVASRVDRQRTSKASPETKTETKEQADTPTPEVPRAASTSAATA